MLDTVIVGAGVSGLALARRLARQGPLAGKIAVFEARGRLGGRIRTVRAGTGAALDLGPSWFWPKTQPLMTQLAAELGLAAFPQNEAGETLHLREADKTPDVLAQDDLHQGAHRLAGGMGALVDALARDLDPAVLHLGHALTQIIDGDDHVALTFATEAGPVTVQARRAVLAVPPRLLAEQVTFVPPLDEETREAMANAATWMADAAKAAIAYPAAVWRAQGRSGNAFVTHEQAVLGEIFDACDADGQRPALAGFLALSPQLRETFAAGLPMLIASQMVQVFGSALEDGEQHFCDWAREPFTASARDLAEPARALAGPSSPHLRRPFWDGRLLLAGTETAAAHAGHMEGALDAARRVERALLRALPGAPADPADLDGAARNDASLQRFSAFVATRQDAAFEAYRRRLVAALSTQARDQVTQIAALGALEEIFAAACAELDRLPFDFSQVAVENGRSALMPQVQAPFRDLIQTLLDDVSAFNATSCALSNFPAEAHLSPDYVQAILRDFAAAWRDFCLTANAGLVARARLEREQGAMIAAAVTPQR